jgi:hypothetical protein
MIRGHATSESMVPVYPEEMAARSHSQTSNSGIQTQAIYLAEFAN